MIPSGEDNYRRNPPKFIPATLSILSNVPDHLANNVLLLNRAEYPAIHTLWVIADDVDTTILDEVLDAFN